MNLVLVGIGGVFGALVRFILGKLISQKSNTTIPIGTFIINISGAILLGIISGINLNKSLYLLMGEGFLGAYTTFSTFMYEGFELFRENEKMNAIVYILSSLFLGVIGFIGGFEIVRLF